MKNGNEITVYPWPKVRNFSFLPLENSVLWKTFYPDLTPELVDPYQGAADYYLLFGVANSLFVKRNGKKLASFDEVLAATKLLGLGVQDLVERSNYVKQLPSVTGQKLLNSQRLKATSMFTELVEVLDRQFLNYLALACGGELRHHSMCSNFPNERRIAWCAWTFIEKEYGPNCYLDAQRLFLDFDSEDSGFGGPSWGDAANLMWERLSNSLGSNELINKQVFVDRVFTLEHNNGCILGKLDWVNKRKLRQTGRDEIGTMPSTVLRFQSSNPPDVAGLFRYASIPVQELVKEHLQTAHGCGIPCLVELSHLEVSTT